MKEKIKHPVRILIKANRKIGFVDHFFKNVNSAKKYAEKSLKNKKYVILTDREVCQVTRQLSRQLACAMKKVEKDFGDAANKQWDEAFENKLRIC